MFLYNAFFGPLPESDTEFKKEINLLFPNVYDTKHLLNTRMSLRKDLPNPNANLSNIFENLI